MKQESKSQDQKKSITTMVVFILLILSLACVGYVAVRDVFRTPAEHLQMGITYLNNKQFKRAEQALARASSSDVAANKAVVIQAAWQLGNLYRKGGEDFPVNGRRAEMFLEKAASLGYAPAQYELALMYDVGDKIPENRQKAIGWMNHAARAGLPEALYGLGVWAERGYMGEPNMQKVVTLYEAAAEQGHINAMKSLVVLYSDGVGKFPYNIERANHWLYQLKQAKQVKQ